MPSYFLPSVYLGTTVDSERLHASVQRMAKANRDRFKSQNEFVKHCLLYAMRHDRTLKRPTAKRTVVQVAA